MFMIVHMIRRGFRISLEGGLRVSDFSFDGDGLVRRLSEVSMGE